MGFDLTDNHAGAAKGGSQVETFFRPWGSYSVLEKGERYQVKRIVVFPKRRLSLQLHHHREEHWVIIKGEGEVLVDDSIVKVKESDRVYIPKLSRHRASNMGDINMEIIEVQLGDYLGEDDIVRFDDDYGRVANSEK